MVGIWVNPSARTGRTYNSTSVVTRFLRQDLFNVFNLCATIIQITQENLRNLTFILKRSLLCASPVGHIARNVLMGDGIEGMNSHFVLW